MSKLKTNDLTLISRDCIGGVLYHQLGLEFKSPTINLFLSLDDFNWFCLHLKKYLKSDISEYKNSGVNYPVGIIKPKCIFRKLKPIKIGFMHYDSFDTAKDKWKSRKERINYKNILVINSCCYETEIRDLNKDIINKWDKIKYPKVILTNEKHGFSDEVVIKKPAECQEFAWLLYSPDKNDDSKRVFNDFDFVNFINKNCHIT